MEELIRSLIDGQSITVRFGGDDASGTHGALQILSIERNGDGAAILTAQIVTEPVKCSEMTTEQTVIYLRAGFSEYLPTRFRIVSNERSTA